jgi:biotin synthase-like enzyme
MVEKFKLITDKLKEKGNVSLFVVLRMDDFIDKWSVVLCADWAKPRDEQSFNEVVRIFKEVLQGEELQTIARIGIFDLNDYIPQLFIKFKTGYEIKQETKINGFVVYEGYVLESANETPTVETLRASTNPNIH